MFFGPYNDCWAAALFSARVILEIKHQIVHFNKISHLHLQGN